MVELLEVARSPTRLRQSRRVWIEGDRSPTQFVIEVEVCELLVTLRDTRMALSTLKFRVYGVQSRLEMGRFKVATHAPS
jgi:hypothetical protein